LDLRQLDVRQSSAVLYPNTMLRLVKALAIGFGCLIVLFGLMQLVPYGRTHENPPITEEPPWDSPRTRELAVRACFNCHSNQTTWPWYANVAPMSWVVELDVANARETINFSEWNHPHDVAEQSGASVVNGDMPPAKYKMAHPEANLNHDELLELARGLNKTLGVNAKIEN
jgi:Haem-binding domain